MKTTVASILALISFAALPLAASAASAPATGDHAAFALRSQGSIPLREAGRYVAPGTYRVQVTSKLGRPDEVLADGTALYHGHRIPESEAKGTLVVRFNAEGRVASLQLATPTVVTALRENARGAAAGGVLAKR